MLPQLTRVLAWVWDAESAVRLGKHGMKLELWQCRGDSPQPEIFWVLWVFLLQRYRDKTELSLVAVAQGMMTFRLACC